MLSEFDSADLDALITRYDQPGPRYTSYPTAVEFHEGFDAGAYRERLTAAAAAATDPLSLYVHLPFCEERCAYCGCAVIATKKRDVAETYLEYLALETCSRRAWEAAGASSSTIGAAGRPRI
jgi:oxygen-independent coproporphyrinogen-3 oxidase